MTGAQRAQRAPERRAGAAGVPGPAAALRLEGQVAVVTGAGRGIGRATAALLARCGAAVVVAEIDEAAADEAAAEIGAAGGRALPVRTDITDDASARACIERAVGAFGGLHILVNNAGSTVRKRLEDTLPEEWDRVVAGNLNGCYLMSRHAIPAMRRSGGGSIVHVASWHARSTVPRFAAYAATKAAVLGLTRQMALDCGPDGIRVNAVAPGIIATGRWQAYLETLPPERREAAVRETLALQPLGRIGTPEDVAGAILFLVSDLAAYVSGATLFVDGAMGVRLAHV
jgi:NAD(P)-dependent dehydrogenase (short-subunit alcohol dehydrogenase family)